MASASVCYRSFVVLNVVNLSATIRDRFHHPLGGSSGDDIRDKKKRLQRASVGWGAFFASLSAVVPILTSCAHTSLSVCLRSLFKPTGGFFWGRPHGGATEGVGAANRIKLNARWAPNDKWVCAGVQSADFFFIHTFIWLSPPGETWRGLSGCLRRLNQIKWILF